MSNIDSAPDATSEDARDEATIARAHAELSAELAAEDAAWDAKQGEDFPGGDVDTDDLGRFANRFMAWLKSQPEVTGAEVVMDNGPDDRGQVSDIIIGLSFGETPVSLAMNVTP